MRHAAVALATVAILAPAAASPQGLEIDHKAVGCIVVGKYPKMNACFTPASNVARGRVYFRPEGVTSWYYVEMKTDQPCYTGVLPKPGKKLVGKKIEYYVESQDKTFNASRTAEYDPVVVRSAQECKKQVPVAPFLNNASVAVFPSLPAGFAAGGIGTGAVLGIVGAGAAAAGTAAIVASNGNDTTTTTVAVGVTTSTTVATTTTTTTTTLAPRTNRPPFAVLTTSPDPPQGFGPLTVTFDMCKSTDPDGDPLNFFFDFGDGAKASGSCLESHTYQASFRAAGNVRALDRSYAMEGCAVDAGLLSACRDRTVVAKTPCPGAPSVALAPLPPIVFSCPAMLPVQASTTNAGAVTFCATPVDHSFCGLGSFPPFTTTPICAAGVASGSTYSATLTLSSFECYRVTADASGCGGTTTSAPGLVLAEGCGLRSTARPQAPGVLWSSDLGMEGARLQMIVNGEPPSLVEHGRTAGMSRVVDGENRIEAVLVETAGRAGTWTIELSDAESIQAGSIRVVAGEVESIGATAVTFRLKGEAGERVVFTFLRR